MVCRRAFLSLTVTVRASDRDDLGQYWTWKPVNGTPPVSEAALHVTFTEVAVR